MTTFPLIDDLQKERCDELHKRKDRFLRTEFRTSIARAEVEDRILKMYQCVADNIKRQVMTKRVKLPIEPYDLAEIVWSCIQADLEAAGFNARLLVRRPNRKDTFKTTLESLEISW